MTARRSSIAPVALGDLVQGQGEVEHPARLNPAGQDAVDQVGQEAADGCRTAAQADLGEEQLASVDGHLVRDADVAGRVGRVRGLPRGLIGADALQGRVRADAAGQGSDPSGERIGSARYSLPPSPRTASATALALTGARPRQRGFRRGAVLYPGRRAKAAEQDGISGVRCGDVSVAHRPIAGVAAMGGVT